MFLIISVIICSDNFFVAAPLGLSERKQDEAPLPLHQAGAGPEYSRQSEAHTLLTQVTVHF